MCLGECVILALVPIALGLEARWTPAADGGGARFSKKWRDAQGIDDSRWTSDPEPRTTSWIPSALPQSLEGWLFAAATVFAIALLYQMQSSNQIRGGQTLREVSGTRSATEHGSRPAPAAEAARAAFLKRYDLK